MSLQTYNPDGNRIIHETSVDFNSRQSIFKPVHLVQYDNKLPILAISLYNNDIPYAAPSGASCNIRLSKPGRKFVMNPALGCSQDRMTVYFEVTTQMVTDYGKTFPIIELIISGNVAGSSPICMIIERNPVQEGDIESSTEAKSVIEYADAAKESAEAAQTAASNAASSASKAESARTTAETAKDNAQTSATDAEQSNTEAKSAAAEAKKSETAAAESLTNAKKAEEAAHTSETTAEDYANKSQSYAVGTGGTYREGDDSDNAKFYHDKMLNYIREFQGVVYQKSINFEELDTVDKQTNFMYNIKDGFVSDDRFTVPDVEYAPGNNVIWTGEGLWDVTAAASEAPVFGSYDSFPRPGEVGRIYVDEEADPRLIYTWDAASEEYVMTGGAGGDDGGSMDIPVTLKGGEAWLGSSAPYYQKVVVGQMREGLTPMHFLSADADDDMAYAYSLLIDYNVELGAITFYAADKPAVDIDIILKGVPTQDLEFPNNNVLIFCKPEDFSLNDMTQKYEAVKDVPGMKAGIGGFWDIIRQGESLSDQESQIALSITDIVRMDGSIKIIMTVAPTVEFSIMLYGTNTKEVEGETLITEMPEWFERVRALEEGQGFTLHEVFSGDIDTLYKPENAGAYWLNKAAQGTKPEDTFAFLLVFTAKNETNPAFQIFVSYIGSSFVNFHYRGRINEEWTTWKRISTKMSSYYTSLNNMVVVTASIVMDKDYKANTDVSSLLSKLALPTAKLNGVTLNAQMPSHGYAFRLIMYNTGYMGFDHDVSTGDNIFITGSYLSTE